MAQEPINQPTIANVRNKKRSILISVAAIIVAVALIVALRYLYGKHLNNVNNYHYQTLSSQNSASTTVDSLGFTKPNEFTQTHKQTQNNNTTAVYSDVDKAGYTIGLMGASVAASDKASDTKYLDGISYLMKEGNGTDYDNFVGYFKDFIGGISGPHYSVQLSQPTTFTNPNIKNNAWVFDVTAKGDSSLAPMQGKFIYAAGKKNFYYFTVLAIQSNWQSNSAVWDQIITSLKLNN